MKNCIAIVLLIKASTIFGQLDDWKLDVLKIHLPDLQHEREVIQSNNGEITYLVKKGKRKARLLNTRHISSVNSLGNVVNTIKFRLQDTLFYLPIQFINKDSIDLHFLETMNLITDSTIIFNSSLYERKIFEFVQREKGQLNITKITPHQREGERLAFSVILNRDTLININVGESESFSPYEFKSVIFLVELHNNHNLFKKIRIDSYLSKECLTYIFQKYVETLKKA